MSGTGLYVDPVTSGYVLCCKVREFGPLIVSIDSQGRYMFEENKVVFNQKKDAAVAEICKHVSFIK